MKVQITKQEGFKPYLFVQANETVYNIETIDEWIRQLELARIWLAGTTRKAVKK